MVGIYFSGTGNSKYCLERFLRENAESAISISIEDTSAVNEIQKNDFIVLAYPVYFSNLPKIMRDFISNNGGIFAGKKIFIIATMGLFSGDGAGCAARLLRRHGADIVGGLHLKMPDCIGDEIALKRSLEQNRRLVKAAESKIANAVNALKSDRPPQEGLGFFYHMAGLFGQRLWFYNKTKNYSGRLNINLDKCVGCGSCAAQCPTQNITITDNKARANGRCTMCYRCVSHCPGQAVTLLGKKLYEQSRIENYI